MSEGSAVHYIKISTFGFQASGKTCLFNIWKGKSVPEEYIKTSEMEFEKIMVNVDGLEVPVLLSDWGYDAMMSCSTSQQTSIACYSEKTDLQIFVLALNSMESYEFVEGAPNSVFFKKAREVQQVAILNKIDLPEEGDLRQKAQLFSQDNEIPIYEITTTNPELCRKTLVDIVKMYLDNNPQYTQKLMSSSQNKKRIDKSKIDDTIPITDRKKEKKGCCIIF